MHSAQKTEKLTKAKRFEETYWVLRQLDFRQAKLNSHEISNAVPVNLQSRVNVKQIKKRFSI